MEEEVWRKRKKDRCKRRYAAPNKQSEKKRGESQGTL